jgi:hypothetical protein
MILRDLIRIPCTPLSSYMLRINPDNRMNLVQCFAHAQTLPQEIQFLNVREN